MAETLLKTTVLPSEHARPTGLSIGSSVICFYLCTCLAIGFMVSSEQFLHWFVIPLIACGVLVGTDAVDWLRGRLPTFDPLGIFSLLGFHFFYLAPMLHVRWDLWMRGVTPPDDWRDWLGGMAILNALGLLLYRAYITRKRASIQQPGKVRRIWRLNKPVFLTTVFAVLILAASVQLALFSTYGGLTGYINVFDEGVMNNTEGFAGLGWVFAIAESFPVLLLMAFVVYEQDKKAARHWLFVILVLSAFFSLRMIFGGLRGSRSNTIWSMVWAVTLIHMWIKPISKKLILSGVLFLLIFVYLYGLYKGAGSEAFSTFTDLDAQTDLAYETGRSLDVVILLDFGRSDVQAFILHRLSSNDRDFAYAWGRTYLGALALPIPRAIWSNRPATKLKEGTEVQYGAGSYMPGLFQSSRQYGIAGEAMLNFGPLAVPLSILIVGVMVARVREWYWQWGTSDGRSLLLPLLINLCFAFLVYDSDNLLYFQLKNGLLPLLVVWFGTSKESIEVTA